MSLSDLVNKTLDAYNELTAGDIYDAIVNLWLTLTDPKYIDPHQYYDLRISMDAVRLFTDEGEGVLSIVFRQDVLMVQFEGHALFPLSEVDTVEKAQAYRKVLYAQEQELLARQQERKIENAVAALRVAGWTVIPPTIESNLSGE